eukprot:1152684-Pelagomonas_calceolata.AAC.1
MSAAKHRNMDCKYNIKHKQKRRAVASGWRRATPQNSTNVLALGVQVKGGEPLLLSRHRFTVIWRDTPCMMSSALGAPMATSCAAKEKPVWHCERNELAVQLPGDMAERQRYEQRWTSTDKGKRPSWCSSFLSMKAIQEEGSTWHSW